MKSSTFAKFGLSSLLSACVVLASGSVSGLVALAEGASRVGTVSFDRSGETLVIPVSGAAPTVSVRKLAARQYLAVLSGCSLSREDIQGQRLSSAVLAGWSMSMAPTGDKVLLRLTLNEDVAPSFQFSHNAKGLVVSFKGNLAQRNTPRLAVHTTPKAVPILHPEASAETQAQAPGPLTRLKHFVGNLFSRPEATETAVQPTPRRHAARSHAAKPQVAATKPAPVAVKPAHPHSTKAKPAPVAAKPHSVAHVAAKPAARPAVVAQAAVFGVPLYDAQRGLLVVPFRGHLQRQSLRPVQLNTRWAYLDVAGARPSFTGVRFGEPHASGLERWVAARRPYGNSTRVSFALSAPSDIAVKQTEGALLVAVTPKTMTLGAKPTAKPAPVADARRAPIQLAGRSLVARPFFDEARYGLVVPYVGPTPLYRWEKSGDKVAVIAIKGNMHAVGEMAQRFEKHRVMSAWKLTPSKTPGVVELAMTFNRSAELVVAADPSRRQLVLIPQPRLGGVDAQASVGGARSVLANVQKDAENRVIYIPFQGQAPSYTVEQVSSTFAYVDFNQARRDDGHVTFYAPDYHPSLNYWLYTDRPATGHVRLALSLTQAAQPRVFEDRAHHRLVVVLDERNAMGIAPSRSAPMVPALWERAHPEADSPTTSPTADIGRRAS